MPDAGPDMSRLGLSALAMIVVLGLTILGVRSPFKPSCGSERRC
jgi:hypothetical protein